MKPLWVCRNNSREVFFVFSKKVPIWTERKGSWPGFWDFDWIEDTHGSCTYKSFIEETGITLLNKESKKLKIKTYEKSRKQTSKNK